MVGPLPEAAPDCEGAGEARLVLLVLVPGSGRLPRTGEDVTEGEAVALVLLWRTSVTVCFSRRDS